MSDRYAKLTLREDSTGGPTKDKVDDVGYEQWFAGSLDCVIYIHGYNVKRKDADKCYDKFISRFDDTNPVAGFYWPGDVKLGWFSFLSYPWKIATARDCAQKLLTYLREIQPLNTGRRFHIVCHSLGARLALETFSRMAPGHLNIAAIYLMAAAVPVPLVEQNAHLDIDNDRIPLRRVFYSHHDLVLHFAFPAGQLAADVLGIEQAVYLEAVGRNGNPMDFPTSRDSKHNGHGDYWKDRGIAHAVAQDLGLATPRPTEERRVPGYETATHEMTEPAMTMNRVTPRRGNRRRIGLK